MNEDDDSKVWEALQATDPVPPQVALAARSAFAYLEMDAQIARLVEDSVLTEVAGVRGSTSLRTLAFESAILVVDVELRPGPDGVDCIGQLVPAQHGTVVFRHADGSRRETQTDDAGRFRLQALARGPVSLRIVLPGAEESAQRMVDTDWLTI